MLDMRTVDQMIDDVLKREGGYVDHPDDRGGATNWGITQNTLSKYYGRAVIKQEVKDLSQDVARDIYEKNYFYGPRIDNLPLSIQAFIFDCAVNHGPRRAVKFVQSVCNQIGYEPGLSEDGAMGPNTRRAAQWAEQAMGPLFLKALIEERRNFYYAIVKSRPSQEAFLKGWLNRVNEFEMEAA